jgi:hypothetical protein
MFLQVAWEEERTALLADAQNCAMRLEKECGMRLQVAVPSPAVTANTSWVAA